LRINPRNLIHHEFIGLEVKVVESKNVYLKGISGVVIDETKNTIVLKRKDGKLVRVPKGICRFMFNLPSGDKVLVDGMIICHRPEDRLKYRVKWGW